jgi:hypothetical protein
MPATDRDTRSRERTATMPRRRNEASVQRLSDERTVASAARFEPEPRLLLGAVEIFGNGLRHPRPRRMRERAVCV